MTPRFLSFIPFIFAWEGGYDNDPDDPGGETKYGIDKRSHPNEDIRNLTRERATEIYFEEYWKQNHCDSLPPDVGEIIMNIAVNCGSGRAGRWLQNLVGAKVDGDIGPKTVAAANAHPDSVELSRALLSRTEAHYRDLATDDRTGRPTRLAKFLRGWLNRNAALKTFLGL